VVATPVLRVAIGWQWLPGWRLSPWFLMRRGAGAVERGGLENRCTRERTVGSNPTPSAIRSRRSRVLHVNFARLVALPTKEPTAGPPLEHPEVARQRMLESGEYGSIAELADAERISRSYVCRVLRLTLLAPEIVERILDGRQAPQLAQLMQPFPVEWERQRERFCRAQS
jgi:hypothetical protein